MQERPDAPTENRREAGKLVPASHAELATARDPYGALGGYGAGPADAPGSLRLNLLMYWRIANKRKWVIISVLGAFVVIGALKTLMETPLYTTGVRLQIDRNVAKIVESGNVTPTEGPSWDTDFLRTQYELLKSRAMG